jgi:ferredoxin
VEEVASIGLDVWLAALAYGAQRVLLVDGGNIATRVVDALQVQLQTAAEILHGLGYAIDAVHLVDSDDVNNACTATMPVIKSATHAGLNEKRRVAFMALDHLFAQSPAPHDIISLSAGAPFGTLQVDSQACTLCLSCTSVCPTHAVYAGNEVPKLVFNEAQCVQCGICATSCPEHVITLNPRLLADPELRQRDITLHEEPALCCISCGKPFATQSVVNNMLAKLEGHWMFQNERAKRRLMMCEDCRVVDIAQDPEAMQQGFMAPPRH